MDRSERPLAALLRVGGVVMALAVIAVFIPRAWMARTHEWLRLGPFPEGPIVVYLARGLSATYAILGGLLLLVARDPGRYAPVITYTAVAMCLLGLVVLALGPSMGMPAWWTIGDGVSAIGFAAAVLVLQARARAAMPPGK